MPVAWWGFAFLPDGRSFLAVNRMDGSVIQWDADTLTEKEWLTFLGTKNSCLALSPNGHWLAVGDGASAVRVFSMESRHQVANLTIPNTKVARLSFSGNRLLASAYTDKLSWEFKLWDVSTWREVDLQGVDLSELEWASLSPDGIVLVTCHSDGSMRWWNLDSGQLQAVFEHHHYGTPSVVFSPDGRLLASSGVNDGLRLWGVRKREVIASEKGRLPGIHGLGFTPDGQRVIVGRDGDQAAQLWDIHSHRVVAILSGGDGLFGFVRLSSDGKTLVAISSDGLAQFWRPPSFEEIKEIENANRAANPVLVQLPPARNKLQ